MTCRLDTVSGKAVFFPTLERETRYNAIHLQRQDVDFIIYNCRPSNDF